MNRITVPNEILIPQIGALLAEGREVELRPKGNSMLPFIRQDKDNVILRKLDTVSRGDIVLADVGGRFVLHRVIRVEDDTLTLMGDVLGTVVAVVKGGKKTVVPSKGRLWQALLPVRRYLLAFYRRVLM